jgi:hypothetical protein
VACRPRKRGIATQPEAVGSALVRLPLLQRELQSARANDSSRNSGSTCDTNLTQECTSTWLHRSDFLSERD